MQLADAWDVTHIYRLISSIRNGRDGFSGFLHRRLLELEGKIILPNVDYVQSV